MAYELFYNSVIGASHIRKGIPCEDFGLKSDLGEFKIFAVADGHGDANCIRSSVGSEYACRIAEEELAVFAQTVKEQGWVDRLFDEIESKKLINRLAISITGKWINSVGEHLDNNCLSEAEMQSATRLIDEYTRGIRTERMYGTTLIAGLLTDSYLLLLQQGDGHCIVFSADGNATQPIPWDERCVGTATTSLCDVDAAQSFRFSVINLADNPVIACIAGTDGVEDSFPSSIEKTHAYYKDLLKYACENGVSEMEAYLSDELTSLSARGSADDITVAGFMDTETVAPFLERFAHENGIVDIRDRVAVLESKIVSIEEGGKFDFLKGRYYQSAERYQRAMEKMNEVSAECGELSEKISSRSSGITSKVSALLKDELDAAKAELDLATEEIEKAQREFFPYKERYDNLLQEYNDAVEMLKKIDV